MRVDKALLIKTPGENYSSGEELINQIFYEIDIEKYKNNSILANMDAKYHAWLDGIEYINPQFFEDVELGQLTKVKVNEALEITQSIYPLLDRVQMHYQVKGMIVLNNIEIKKFLKRAFEEYFKIQEYESIKADIDALNEKIEELKKDSKTLRARRTVLNKKLKLTEKDAKKGDEKALADKTEIESSLKKIANKFQKNTEEMNKLDSKLSNLKVMAHESKPLIYNLFSEYTSLFNLLTKYEILAVNDEQDLIILNVGNKKGDTSLTIKGLSSFIEDIKEKRKTKKEIIQMIVDQWKKVGPMEFKFKLNSVSSKVYKEETFFEIEDEGLLKHQLDILAPVKPTIAAAMLASGSTGAFSHEIPIENEKCLIKTVISPVVKVTKEFSRHTGDETTVTIKTWEPRLGIFNKTRKSFKVLTQ